MTPRLDYLSRDPKSFQALLALSAFVTESGIEPELMELMKIRASQINGCGFCLHMHLRDARKMGMSAERLDLIAAWRESPLYSERERAALAWTEKLTRLAEHHISDQDYAEMAAQFSGAEQVRLTMVIIAINGWNRMNAGFGMVHPVALAA